MASEHRRNASRPERADPSARAEHREPGPPGGRAPPVRRSLLAWVLALGLLGTVLGGCSGRALESTSLLSEPLPRLPHGRREAAAIARHLGSAEEGGGAVLLLDAEATRDRLLLASRVSILHLAVHGEADDAFPALSSLYLSPLDSAGSPVSGRLRTFDIARLDLRSELVFLPACETASVSGADARVRLPGRGNVAEAFLWAGARRVIASLWAVRDEATADLVETFYLRHLGEGMPPLEALHRTQLDLMSRPETAAPHHWASLVYYGDWRPPEHTARRVEELKAVP